jgi:predicted nucleic acid-binding protein
LGEVISDTSPLQYLHQLRVLHLLPHLADTVVIPPAVQEELRAGTDLGINLPDLQQFGWLVIRSPLSRPTLPYSRDLGSGETEVLLLGLEAAHSTLLLDDALARRVAEGLELPFTGTLGIILRLKELGLVPAILPLLDQLQQFHFRLSPQTRSVVLRLAAEEQ